MSEELMITQQDLIDWIDRPPSNDDLDLATFISTRLENFYELEKQLHQKESIIKGLDNTIENLEEVVEHKDNIIKEVREYLKLREDDNSMCSVCGVMSDRILEILEKAGDEK